MFPEDLPEQRAYLAIVAAILLGLYLSSLHSYLLFHSLIEIITISIGFTLFIITWNGRRFLSNGTLKLLGIGYAFIALIDLLHTLAYKGMNVFPGYGANLPTQLWIGARYLQALTLCAAPFFMGRRLHVQAVMGGFAGAVALLVALVYTGNFPDCFVEGKGLTPFKIGSEYAISGALLVALVFYYRHWRRTGEKIYPLVIASIACTTASELAFTTYLSVYGFANLLGHFFKLIAYYLIYQAILVTGFREPLELFFRELRQAYDRLREANTHLELEMEERIHAEDELRQARDSLEVQVDARTTELRAANERLQDELVEIELVEETLREKEEYIRRLVEESPVAMLVTAGVEQRVAFMNRKFGEIFGYTADEVPDLAHWWPLAYPDEQYRDAVRARWASRVATLPKGSGEIEPLEELVTDRNGRQRIIEFRMSSIGDHNIVTFTDLTDRYGAAENERLLSAIVQSSDDAIIAKDLAGVILAWNSGAERTYGYSAAEAIGRNISLLQSPDIPDELPVIMGKIMAGESLDHYVTERLTKDGQRIFVSLSISPLRDRTGAIVGAATIARDITEMRRAQVELANQTQLLEAFFENSMTCNVILDRAFNFIRVNSAYARSDNRRVEDFPGRNHFELYPSDAKALFEEVVAAKQPLEVEARSFAYPDDPARSQTYWDWSLVPTLNEAGEVDKLIFILRDVTEHIKSKSEREHLQAQLFQAQKMEAVGQLAGGVAHDFNNILTAIIGFSTLMEMKMAPDDPQRTSVNQILAAADRAAELTRSLLAFSRKQIINPQPADLNQIVQQTGRFLQRIIGEDIELRMTFNEEHLPVNVDSVQIEQVLMNLATNARDVMPGGGLLSIGTELVEIGDTFIRAHGFGIPGEYALITVTDTGSGMDEEVRKRIFEPFFTTKEVGRGTGLGLSIVYGIIKQHNGFINVYSEPGQGTTFTIYLRLHRAESELKPAVVRAVPMEGTETILVADDDPMLRNIAEEVFRSYGYTVITAEDGQDAVEKFSRNRERIALVVLDVIMPKMNGKDAYEQIRKLSPGCKAIFMSGYTDDIIHKRGLLDVGLAFVSKPLRPEKLLQKAREVLDMAQGGWEQVAEGTEQ